ncbi:hypothetical protein NEH60_13270, partial [Xanthomonas hortorum pv. pelargonii]|uniref:hypothetical protein n=1 Tax=Xanthomonas hortorum TaxID=56454 RepID=UPI0020431707
MPIQVKDELPSLHHQADADEVLHAGQAQLAGGGAAPPAPGHKPLTAPLGGVSGKKQPQTP